MKLRVKTNSMSVFAVIFVVYAALCMGVVGAVAWVLWHFISRLW